MTCVLIIPVHSKLWCLMCSSLVPLLLTGSTLPDRISRSPGQGCSGSRTLHCYTIHVDAAARSWSLSSVSRKHCREYTDLCDIGHRGEHSCQPTDVSEHALVAEGRRHLHLTFRSSRHTSQLVQRQVSFGEFGPRCVLTRAMTTVQMTLCSDQHCGQSGVWLVVAEHDNR